MKKYLYIILAICLAYTMCTACAPGPDSEPYGCMLVDLESRTNLYLNAPGISATISGYMPQEAQWKEANNIQDLQDYMYNQICQHLDKPNAQEGAGYVYGTLTDVRIIANHEVEGRDSGENLADLFEFKFIYPLYLYPSGELVEYSNWQNPTTKTLTELLDKEFFLPLSFVFTRDELNAEGHETILFTLSLTISDGTSEKTLTSDCTLEL